MSDSKTCPRCGALLENESEPCPRCLLTLGRRPDETGASAGGASSAPRKRKRAIPTLEEIASRFPELEVQALIGEGGMGAVYKVRQPKIGRTVALKVLALDPSDDPTFAERFRREAMVLARLDHVHVVKLYDFGERDGLYYLVLEFVDGTNLRSLMKQGLLTPKLALAVVREMCEALQFAHDEGIVHRDIKPENVLIDTKGRVKIADFGLAKIVDADPLDVSLTEIGQVMGTPHYMAPEQLRGAADVDHRADIYSLGVVFYEMLTGDLPRGKFDMPSKHVHVDVRLDEIVLKSLERAPERRYQHAVEVKTDVESVGMSGEKSHLNSLLDSIPESARKAVLSDIAEARARGEKAGDRVVVVYPNRPWQYFVMFLMLWPLAGWAFNGGAGWFIAAMLLVAASFWSLMEREVRAQPGLEEALKSERRDVTAARHMIAIVLLVLSFFTLYLGHAALFDDMASNYRPGPNDPEVMHTTSGLQSVLLPALEAHLPLATSIDRGHAEFTRQLYDPMDRENLYHQPWLVLVAAALCLVTAAVFSSRWSELSAWRGWRIPVRTTASLLGSLVLLHAVCALIQFASHDGEPFVPVTITNRSAPHSMTSDHGTEELAHDLRLALVGRGFATTATGVWSIKFPDVENEKALRVEHDDELSILFADPSSLFDRWRMTWSGPARTQPHVVLVVHGSRDANGTARAECDLGDLRENAAERAEWVRSWSRLLP